MQYSITLQAGVEKRQEFSGTTLVLLDTGAASAIDIKVEVTGFPVEELRGVKRGLKLRAPGFSGASFKATVNCTLEVVVSDADISVNYQDGATVNANIIGTVPVNIAAQGLVPIQTANDRGAPANPVYVASYTANDAPATNLNNLAAVAVTAVETALVAVLATRRSLRFTNIGANPVAIGSPTITWAKRAIVLNPGDVWVEDRAANLAWSAICDAAQTASVTMQEVLA